MIHNIQIHKRQYTHGFTLMEIMIVIAIIGVLASLSIFNNGNAVERTLYRTAKNDLLELTNHLEREYLRTNNYPPETFTLPFTASPRNEAQPSYTINYRPDSNRRNFVLTAAPRVGDTRATRCGTITLNNVGQWTTNTVCD